MPFDYLQQFRAQTVLITGGAGFIGSHLANRLAALGAHVRVIDDLSGGFRENVPGDAKFIHASILDQSALRQAASGCTYIFHEAAMVSVPESVEHPDRCAEINITGTLRVLEAARDAAVKRMVFAASAAAYGESLPLPHREDQAVDPRSPYAESKVAGERLCAQFSESHLLSTVCLRYFNVFGPRQNPDSAYAAVISAFTKALKSKSKSKSGQPPILYGDGRQTRDFTHIDNVVHANLLAASSPRDLKGDVINIGTGVRISLLEVLDHMSRILNVRVQPTFAPPRAGDVRDSVADIHKATTLLGYEPNVDFAEGLNRTLREA